MKQIPKWEQLRDIQMSPYNKEKLPNQILNLKIETSGERYPLFGFSSEYDTTYPLELLHYVSREEYGEFINTLNAKTKQNFPSKLTQILAYGCSVCSCFISLRLPILCFGEGQRVLDLFLGEQNILWEQKGIFVSIEENKCSQKSYLLLKIRETDLPISMEFLDSPQIISF